MLALRALAMSAIVFFVTMPGRAQSPPPIRWETNLDKALQQAQASDRLVLAHFWAEWCGPCRTMESTVFSQSGFGQALATHFVAVKIDYDQNQAVAKRLGVTRFPTDLILDSKGQVLFKQEGAKNASDYQAIMLGAAAKLRAPAVASKPSAPATGAINTQTPLTRPSLVPSLPSAGSQTPPVQAQPARNTTTSATPAQDDRYSYYNQRGNEGSAAATVETTVSPAAGPAVVSQGVAAQPVASPALAPPTAPVASVPAATLSPSAATTAAPTIMAHEPRVAAQVPAQSVSSMNQVVAQAVTPAPYNPTSAASSRSATHPNSIYGAPKSTEPITQDKLPPGSPPLAMEGFCPVTLCERRVWTQGDVLWGAVHRGRTYLFASAADQQKFLQNPDRFSPVLSGLDPVLSLDMGQSINGRREHGVFFGDRIYLFSNEQTLSEFEKNPNRYAAEIIQAMR